MAHDTKPLPPGLRTRSRSTPPHRLWGGPCLIRSPTAVCIGPQGLGRPFVIPTSTTRSVCIATSRTPSSSWAAQGDRKRDGANPAAPWPWADPRGFGCVATSGGDSDASTRPLVQCSASACNAMLAEDDYHHYLPDWNLKAMETNPQL